MANKSEQVKKMAEFIGHKHPIYVLEAAPEPGRFFSGGGDKTIVEWDVKNPEEGIPIAQFKFTIYSLCTIPEKKIVLAGTSEGGIHVIDLSTKKEIKYFQLPGEAVFDIRYSHEHDILVASTAKGQLLFISPNDLTVQGSLQLSTEKIRNISFNSGRPYLYVACSDTKVYVVDLNTHQTIYEFTGHNWATNALYYHAGKDELITASKDAHIRVWDIKKQFEMIKSVPAHNYAIYQIVFNPLLKIFATASRDKTIKLWDEEMNILIRIDHENFEAHTNSVNSVIWLDNHHLVSAGDDRKIFLWKVSI